MRFKTERNFAEKSFANDILPIAIAYIFDNFKGVLQKLINAEIIFAIIFFFFVLKAIILFQSKKCLLFRHGKKFHDF